MYLIELFSEKSDQVRLVTFLLSALLAVFVILINQYFITRRNRRDMLLEKIEDLYKISIEYTDTCSEVLDDIENQVRDTMVKFPTVTREHKRKVQGLIQRMEMICGLHFPSSEFDPNDYRLWNMEVLEYLEKGKHTAEGEMHLKWEDAKQHIVDSDAKLAFICSKLVDEHGYKT